MQSETTRKDSQGEPVPTKKITTAQGQITVATPETTQKVGKRQADKYKDALKNLENR